MTALLLAAGGLVVEALLFRGFFDLGRELGLAGQRLGAMGVLLGFIAALLLVYWALNLPVLGQEVALMARQYPAHRNVTLRLLEPLGAPEETNAQVPDPVAASHPARSSTATPPGVAIVLEGVSVRAAGHTILDKIDLDIEAGAHVAIVGPSGAGKSSLVGILLG